MIKGAYCVDSIARTIKKVKEILQQRCEEFLIITIHGLMAGMGNSKTGITLFEALVILSLLFNCESWIGINETHINTLQSFQDPFISRLLHLPMIGTAKSLLRMDGGMMLNCS